MLRRPWADRRGLDKTYHYHLQFTAMQTHDKTTVVHLRLPESLMRLVRATAKRDDRTQANVMRHAIKEWLRIHGAAQKIAKAS
jgi:hypothetical protein